MSSKIKLAYCLLGIYKAGGLERITAAKVNYFASVGYDVYLITSSQAGRDFYYKIDPRVKHIDLDVRHDLYEQLPRVRAYIESVKKDIYIVSVWSVSLWRFVQISPLCLGIMRISLPIRLKMAV